MTLTTETLPRREVVFSISPAAAQAIGRADSDWELVYNFVGISGKYARLFTTAESEAVRRLADGFGRITPDSEFYADMIWDFSHVRDSSPEAVAAMAAWIRAWIKAYTR